jgi:hypothetical protein
VLDRDQTGIGTGSLAEETAWAAVYRNGKLVAEDQQGDDDSGLL